MPRRRRAESLIDVIFDILLSIPIWLGPILALLVYATLRFLWPIPFGTDDPGKAIVGGLGPAVAPWAGLAIIVMWIIAELRKWQRRKLLDAQAG